MQCQGVVERCSFESMRYCPCTVQRIPSSVQVLVVLACCTGAVVCWWGLRECRACLTSV
jgi:hypothetical protein